MPDSRLSDVLSELVRSERGAAFGAMEMSHYGVLSDYHETGDYRKYGIPRPYKILERHGYTWKSVWEAVANRTNIEIEFRESDWTGEETVRVSGGHYFAEWLDAIPTTSQRGAEIEYALSFTP